MIYVVFKYYNIAHSTSIQFHVHKGFYTKTHARMHMYTHNMTILEKTTLIIYA